MRRTWLIGAVVAAALIVVALLVRLGPALSLALALVRPDAEPWLAPVLDVVSVEETSVAADARRLVAELYRPSAPARSAAARARPVAAGHRHLVLRDIECRSSAESSPGSSPARVVKVFATMAELSERHGVRVNGKDQTIVFVADSADGRLIVRQEPTASRSTTSARSRWRIPPSCPLLHGAAANPRVTGPQWRRR
jgi:hypothetical protein